MTSSRPGVTASPITAAIVSAVADGWSASSRRRWAARSVSNIAMRIAYTTAPSPPA